MTETTETPAAEVAVPAEDRKPKLIISDNKLGLTAPGPMKGKNAQLTWAFFNNNPRITIFTREPAEPDNNNGMITANLDMPHFNIFLERLANLATIKEEYSESMHNWNFTYENDVKSVEPSKTSELWIGRDADGSAWISVTAANRPKIKFYFGISEFHFLKKGDGSEFSKREIGDIYLRAYVKMLSEIMNGCAVKAYIPWEKPEGEFQKKPYQPKGNYQGGGNNYKQGGGNNWNKGGNNNYRQNNNGGGGGGNWNRGGGGNWNKNNYNNNHGGNRQYNNNSAPAGGSGTSQSDDDLPF